MKSELKLLLERIDQLKAEVDKFKPLKPEQEQRLMQKVRLDWNYHSSHIEGNTLTYGETKALLLWGITAGGKPIKDHLEMKGHNEVINLLFEIIKEKNRPLTEQFIREMHEIILGEPYYTPAITLDGKQIEKLITPGKYKTQPNHVITPSGDKFFFASPEETPAKMMDLIAWFKENDARQHPLLTAASFHYQFVRIHPFDDGNGRMARILMNFILMMHDYPPAIISTDDREGYLQSLAYADSGDLEKFIEYIGEQENTSLELVMKAAKGETIDEYEDIDKMINLLKKKMDWNELDDNIIIELNNEIVIETIKNNVVPLFNEFINVMKKFDPLFKKRKNSIIIYGQQQREINFNDIENEIELYLKKIKVISGLGCRFNFNNLLKKENFSLDKELIFEMDQFYYNISTQTPEKQILKKRYHQKLSENDIRNIITSIVSEIYNNIDNLENRPNHSIGI